MTRAARSRSTILVAALLAASTVLVGAGSGSALADWTTGDVTRDQAYVVPSLALDGSGKTSAVFARLGDQPGIYLGSDATGSWSTVRLTDEDDFWPAIAVDDAGKRHVVYSSYGASPGIYYMDDVGGAWSTPQRLSTDQTGEPSIAIDAGGHVHIVYVSRSFQPGLYYVTNATGAFETPARIVASHRDDGPSLAIDSLGHLHIAWARFAPEAPGLYYMDNATGPWVASRLTTSYAGTPSLVLDGSDKAHIAYVKYLSSYSALHDISNATGSWVDAALWDDAAYDVGRPTSAIDQGTLYVASGRFAKDPVNVGGSGMTIYFGGGTIYHLPDDPAETDGRTPSMAFDGAHVLHLAYVRMTPTPGLAYYSADATSLQTTIDSRTLAGSVLDSSASLALDPGTKQQLAFERQSTASDDGIMAGTDASGPWAVEHAAPTEAEPALAVDSAGHRHIAYADGTDVHHATDATGSWVDEVVGPGEDPGIAIGPSDEITLAYQSNGQLTIARKTIGSFFILPTSVFFYRPTRPSIEVDSTSRTHGTLIDQGQLFYFSFKFGADGGTQFIGEPVVSSVLRVDGAGHASIAYQVAEPATAAGTYLATNASGLWVKTRLTRTTAETAPSLALDASGHAYLAIGRYDWAADPGIYLVSNRTGAWVTTRVTTGSGDIDPTIVVDASGRARIVYQSGWSGLSNLVQIDPLGVTAAQSTMSASEGAVARAAGMADGPPSGPLSISREHEPSTGSPIRH